MVVLAKANQCSEARISRIVLPTCDPHAALRLWGRYYDPGVGRFNGLDPFAGNVLEPLSLHKYLYTEGDPVNGIDPTGQWTTSQVLTTISVGSLLASVTLPTIGGAIIAASKGVSLWDYVAELGSSRTWAEAATIVGVGAGVGKGLQVGLRQTAIQLGNRAAGSITGVISLATSLWSLYQSTQILDALKDLPKQQIAHVLAVETATATLSAVLLQARRAVVKNPLNEGAYTEKVIEQMTLNVNKPDRTHAFSGLVDKFVKFSDATVRVGRDGLPATVIRRKGAILTGSGWQDGTFEYIIDAAGRINHRQFQ